jgi:hypothetical protein
LSGSCRANARALPPFITFRRREDKGRVGMRIVKGGKDRRERLSREKNQM